MYLYGGYLSYEVSPAQSANRKIFMLNIGNRFYKERRVIMNRKSEMGKSEE